jgi:hypothetical protein
MTVVRVLLDGAALLQPLNPGLAYFVQPSTQVQMTPNCEGASGGIIACHIILMPVIRPVGQGDD